LPGATVNVRNIHMTFDSHMPNRSAMLEIIGSGSTITHTVGTFLANHPTATVKFTADAAGVSPIVSVGIAGTPSLPPGGADVTDGNLVLDLDDFNFTPSSTLLLFDGRATDAENPDPFLFGPFGTVTFVGDTTATVNYDFANGDIFLSDFESTAPPDLFGDYNDDGEVDAADYVTWRKLNGTSTTLPNDQTPGSVLPVDYDVWKQNFGETGSGSSAPVPEPTSLALTTLLLVGCASKQRFCRP
jgi:hypothetical protein